MDRRSFVRNTALLTAGVAGAQIIGLEGWQEALAATPYRAFSDNSEWNRPLPRNAPISKHSAAFIRELKSFDPQVQFPRLVDGSWAEPIFWAKQGDPYFSIAGVPVKLRIPRHARPASTSDAQVTIYDRGRRLVAKLQGARYSSGKWYARNSSIYYLRSNGLDGDLRESNNKRNYGHRGIAPPTHAVRLDEVRGGAIKHVLKVALRRTAPKHVYPAVGDQSGSGSIPMGAMFRIKPSVDLTRRGLTPSALVVARAMQRFGVVIGDQSGVPMALKLENLALEGRSARWSELRLGPRSLERIHFDDFECIRLGYHRP
jgi:hypothetical protein